MLKPCLSRWFYFVEFLSIISLLAFAYYLEIYQGLLPCPLCEAQRLVFALLGVFFLLTSILPPKKWFQILMNLLISLIALMGVVFAGRQVWLQYMPAAVGEGTCDVSLQYMVKIMPWSDVLLNLLLGGPECAKITWQFLHLSIAAWALVWFLGFFLLALWQMLGWVLKR